MQRIAKFWRALRVLHPKTHNDDTTTINHEYDRELSDFWKTRARERCARTHVLVCEAIGTGFYISI